MRQLGFHTDSTYLNLRYPGNTLLMDSIFGIKYNISQAQPPKFGFSPVSNALAKPEPVSSFTLLAIGSIEFTWVL